MPGADAARRRIEASLSAVFTTVTESVAAELVDISCGGARLRGGQLPSPGEEVMLTVNPVKAYGLVAWRHPDECGMSFEPGIGRDDVEALGRRASNIRGLPLDLKEAMDDWNGGFVR